MLYSEFVVGTGCRDNDHNYKVYKDLEIMYMNSDMSKQEIYEYGKLLVDNSKTERELAIEEKTKAEIAEIKDEIAHNKVWIDHYQTLASISDGEELKRYKETIKVMKERNKGLRNRIKALKWLLE